MIKLKKEVWPFCLLISCYFPALVGHPHFTIGSARAPLIHVADGTEPLHRQFQSNHLSAFPYDCSVQGRKMMQPSSSFVQGFACLKGGLICLALLCGCWVRNARRPAFHPSSAQSLLKKIRILLCVRELGSCTIFCAPAPFHLTKPEYYRSFYWYTQPLRVLVGWGIRFRNDGRACATGGTADRGASVSRDHQISAQDRKSFRAAHRNHEKHANSSVKSSYFATGSS